MDRPAPSIEEFLSHAQFVRGIARGLLRDEHGADDAVQQTYMAALTNPPDRGQPVRPWLATVVRNFVRRAVREERRRTRRERRVAAAEAQPAATGRIEHEEILRRVVDAVLSLDPRYREVVLLHYYEGLSYAKTARRLSIPVETVRSRLKRARTTLRRRLGERRCWAPVLGALAGVKGPKAGGLAATGGVIMGTQGKLAVVASMAAVLMVAGLWRPWSPGSGEQAARTGRAEAEGSAAPGTAERQEPAPVPVPETVVEHVVRGTVRDEAGKPVEGASVFVGAESNPFEGKHTAQLNNWFGRTVTTDPRGGYQARFDAARRVHVSNWSAGRFRAQARPGVWVETPAEGVDFVTRVHPVATLVVRVNDLAAGRALQQFTCTATARGGRQASLTTRTGIARGELVLPLKAREHPVEVVIVLTAPRRSPPLMESLQLVAGDHREITLSTRVSGRLRGLVVDGDGRPLEEALVYFGSQIRARGDEPFRAFDARRIKDGDRTDGTGAYELLGQGEEVTAWHPEYSSVTVAVSESARIVLSPRGSIRGRVLDGSGNPVAGLELRLDRTARTTTARDGSFGFDKVEAGTRGLMFPDRNRMVGIRVKPGETSNLEIGTGLPKVRIELTRGGNASSASFTGGIAGVGEGDYLVRVGKVRKGVFELTDVWPGRYLFIGTRGNYYGWVSIESEQARVDLGGASLTVRAKPGLRVSVIPDGVDEQIRKIGVRLTQQKVPGTGVVVFEPLPTGRYEICTGTHEFKRRAMVQVDAEGAEVTLDPSD